MPITFVAQDFWNNQTSYDETEFLPLTVGDVLLAFLQNVDPTDAPVAPAGWTELTNSPAVLPDPPSSFFATMWGYVHVIEEGDTGIYDFDNGDPETLGWRANFIEYSGVDLDSPVEDNSFAGNGNATVILTLPAVVATRTGSRLLVATANQITTQPTVEGFTDLSDGFVYLFDKATPVGSSGDVDVVSANEFGTGWDVGFLIVLNPPIEAGARFDCSAVDSQIN